MPRGEQLQQQNAQQHIEIDSQQQFEQQQEVKNDFLNANGWEQMTKEEELEYELQAKSRYKAPNYSAAQKKELKKFVKDHSDIRNNFKELNIGMLSLWGQSSKNIDGAGAEFTKLADSLYSFSQSYNKLDGVLQSKKVDAKFEIDDEAVVLIRAAQAYIALHGNERQFSSKGKNRMALARYVVSSDFITKYLVDGKYNDAGNNEMVLSKQYDAESFIFEHQYRKCNRKRYALANKPEAQGVIAAFKQKYAANLTDNRNQLSLFFSLDEKMNEKTLQALQKTLEDPADMTLLYQIMDEKVNETLQFKLTPEMFTKEYILKNPGILTHLSLLTSFSGDAFEKDSIYRSIGIPYFENLRRNHPEAAEAFDAKSRLLAWYGNAINENTVELIGVSNHWVTDSVSKNHMNNQDRSYRAVFDEEEEPTVFDLETFKSDLVSREFKEKYGDKYYTTTYNFNRKKNKERYDELKKLQLNENKASYEKTKKLNEDINQASLNMLDSLVNNDARRLMRYYVPKGSQLEKKLESLIKKDIEGSNDFDRVVAGMLKMVRFDNMGDPLPEYSANHQWNLNWIKGYMKAMSNPEQRVPEYEQCLTDSIQFITSDENIHRLEKICLDKSFDQNADDMEFMLKMSEVSLKLFDNHMRHSKAAKPLWDSLGEDREKMDAKMSYVSNLVLYYSTYFTEKYHINFSNKTFDQTPKEVFSEISKSFKDGYKEYLNISINKLKTFVGDDYFSKDIKKDLAEAK